MNLDTEVGRMSDAVCLGIKQYLNNGIPDVHLSKGCIGELCVYSEDGSKCAVIINLWQSEFNDFLGLRNEFKRLGASDIYITQTMDDESDCICNGIYEHDDVRTITVEFSLGNLKRNIRSKAFRDLWDMAYRMARTERFKEYAHGMKEIYPVKNMLKVIHTFMNDHSVDLGDVIDIVDQAIDASMHDMYIWRPTRSELRRFELEREAKGFTTTEELLNSLDEFCPF